MKKSFTKRILVLLVILVMASGALFAADLTVTGTIADETSLELGATLSSGSYSAALNYNGPTTWTDFGTLTAITNSYGGYIIGIESSNGFTLVSPASSLGAIAYDLAADNGGITLSADGDLVTANTQTAAIGVEHKLTLVAAAPDLGTIHSVGSYADTITITITAK
jgi:hypothetical protein